MIFELGRYVVAGVINTVVGYLVFLIMLKGFGANIYVSNTVSYIIGVCFAYMMNAKFVFKGKSASMKSFGIFVVGFILAFGVNLWILNLLKNWMRPEFSQIFAMAAYTVVFYLYNKLLVFR